MQEFKKKFSFEKRRDEAERIMKKYPDRVPIIVEKSKGSQLPDIDKRKYLVPYDLTVGQFIFVIRKRLKLKPEEAIFLFVNNTIPATSALISTIYKEHKDTDSFLYLIFSGESFFG